MYFVFFIIIVICSYYSIQICMIQKRNERRKYKLRKENLLIKRLETLKWMSKVKLYLSKIAKDEKDLQRKTTIFFLTSISLSIIIFFVSFLIFQIYGISFIVSIFSFYLPYFLIQNIVYEREKKLILNFPMYILSLKHYVYLTNNIILALKKTTPPIYLSKQIIKLNVSLESGLNIVQAFQELNEGISIKEINQFFHAILICHLNGSDMIMLLDKYAAMISKKNEIELKQRQENFSNILVFWILVVIYLFLLIMFIYTNETYREIITNTFIGKGIISMNLLSYILLFFLYRKIYQK